MFTKKIEFILFHLLFLHNAKNIMKKIKNIIFLTAFFILMSFHLNSNVNCVAMKERGVSVTFLFEIQLSFDIARHQTCSESHLT